MKRHLLALVGCAASWSCSDNTLPLPPVGTLPDRCDDPGHCAVLAHAVGSRHACARLEGGAVECWGNNEFGQARPDLRTVREPLPVKVNLANATAIAVGGTHSCAVIDGGLVECWGRNNSGQLGVGNDLESGAPTVVADFAGKDRLALGYETSCAGNAEHQWWCWGAAAAGGDGRFGSHVRSLGVAGHEAFDPLPGRAIAADGAVEISLGSYLGCMRDGAGVVRCWGYWQADGRYGWRDPTVVEGIVADKVVASGFFGCALSKGSIACWSTFDLVPIPVPGIESAIDLVQQNDRFCSIDPSGDVACWDGGPETNELIDPSPALELGEVTELLGGGMLCGKRAEGTWCFGTVNDYGQHGDGTALIDPEPRIVPVRGHQLSADTYDICALAEGGTVACWGTYQPEEEPERIRPTQVRGVSGAIAIDGRCALLGDGSVQCWYPTDWGVVDSSSPAIPLFVPAQPFVQIAHEMSWGCGRSATGEVSCWSPRVLTQPGVYQQIAAAGQHVCGILGDGEVRCWGSLYTGDLEDGKTETMQSDVPWTIELPGPAQALWADEDGSCARLGDQSVWCWGKVPFGDYATIGSPAVHVPELDGALDLSIGIDGACWIAADSAVRCAGDNTQGINGSNNYAELLPSPIGGALQVVRSGVAACAVKDGEQISCWGNGAYGIFGDGSGPAEGRVFELGP